MIADKAQQLIRAWRAAVQQEIVNQKDLEGCCIVNQIAYSTYAKSAPPYGERFLFNVETRHVASVQIN